MYSITGPCNIVFFFQVVQTTSAGGNDQTTAASAVGVGGGGGGGCAWLNYPDINIFTDESPESLGNSATLAGCQELCATTMDFQCASILYYTDDYA